MADAHEQMRRARLFSCIVRRRDLVSFWSIADWYGRENADRRNWALQDLGAAATRGEFGPPERRILFYLPAHLPTYRPFWILRNGMQVAGMRAHNHDETADLWAPRSLCAKWLEGRGIPLPPWLDASPVPPAISLPVDAGEQRPRVLGGSKVKKAWDEWIQTLPQPPTKRRADSWAKANNYSTTVVRPLHKALGKAPGRPRKMRNGQQ